MSAASTEYLTRDEAIAKIITKLITADKDTLDDILNVLWPEEIYDFRVSEGYRSYK